MIWKIIKIKIVKYMYLNICSLKNKYTIYSTATNIMIISMMLYMSMFPKQHINWKGN